MNGYDGYQCIEMDFLKIGNDNGYTLEFSIEPHSIKKYDFITLYLNNEAILHEYVKKIRRVTPTFYDIRLSSHCIMIEYAGGVLYSIITKDDKLIHKLSYDKIIKQGKKQLGIMHMFFNE